MNKKMMIASLGALVLFTAGCGGKTLKVSNRFTPAEETLLSDAAEEWCAVSPDACINLIFGAGADADVLKLSGRARINSETGQRCGGLTYRETFGDFGDKILLLPDNPLGLRLDALHEFGHVLGLEHSTGGQAVMNPGNIAKHLTQIDRDAFWAK